MENAYTFPQLYHYKFNKNIVCVYYFLDHHYVNHLNLPLTNVISFSILCMTAKIIQTCFEQQYLIPKTWAVSNIKSLVWAKA